VRDVAAGHERVKAPVDGGALMVMCDRGRIYQLLTIILDNAIKYSPSGSYVEMNVVPHGSEVEVTVKDHGPGMPENGAAAAMTNGNGTGATGLGLPIAREIVRMHGGRIWFVSKPGQGTHVHFTLPTTAVVTVAKAGSAA